MTDSNPPLDASWQQEAGYLYREFQFSSFESAMTFINEVAILAQELNHHPWWENCYDRVTIRLRSFDVRDITDRDISMANAISNIFNRSI